MKSVSCNYVFRILKLWVPSVNRIFPLRVLTAGAISLFLNIMSAIAPVAPVLNTPLHWVFPDKFSATDHRWLHCATYLVPHSRKFKLLREKNRIGEQKLFMAL